MRFSFGFQILLGMMTISSLEGFWLVLNPLGMRKSIKCAGCVCRIQLILTARQACEECVRERPTVFNEPNREGP